MKRILENLFDLAVTEENVLRMAIEQAGKEFGRSDKRVKIMRFGISEIVTSADLRGVCGRQDFGDGRGQT